MVLLSDMSLLPEFSGIMPHVTLGFPACTRGMSHYKRMSHAEYGRRRPISPPWPPEIRSGPCHDSGA
jgi:hypothetical protein